MKKSALALSLFLTIGLPAQAHADGWLDTLKGWLGMSSDTSEQPAATEAQTNTTSSFGVEQLVGVLSAQLGVSETQAEGGLASILEYVKGNLSQDKFSQLADSLPGVKDILSSAPEVTAESGDGSSMSALLNKAAEYSDSLKSVNQLKQQFDALGLDPEMISKYVTQINDYLDSEEGKQAKQLLKSGLGNLLG